MSDVEGIVASVDAKKGAKVEKGDALITVYSGLDSRSK